MRSLAESRSRWDETLRASSSFADLQRAVKFNGPSSPCVAGCRSVCWKAFLLFRSASASNWSHVLLESRNTYSALREHYLKYIKHPEQLAQLSLDPLADDPESPWDAFRRDEAVRAEILQDVRRLPDEHFYHQESTQTLILDILFIYCKLNPEVDGYRQGMHELLAPIVYVVANDAIDRAGAGEPVDPVMVEMLDSYFVEHDAFALFSRIMEKAKSFYEVSNSPGSAGLDSQSAIVDMSREIHEATLMKVDQELANHLKSIEVLPQIFLIRWIRLLFGREFPFDQLLVLWDTIFAFDPTLDLIPLVCVAMLIRIRWTLLEADYSVALQLLLKYPAPDAAHGPHTFVDDAVYLKDHLSSSGGANLILKYTGRAPSTPTLPGSFPGTLPGLSLRHRTLGARSPLPSPARFIQNREGVEALFQGAAKGVIERGEKLGINRAVRDAMGEIRRNMQGFQEARGSQRVARDHVSEDAAPKPLRSVAQMERRNRQLAAMLDEAVAGLKSIAATVAASTGDSSAEGSAAEAIEIAAAKIQLVKVYLEDSSSLPSEDEQQPPPVSALSFTSNKENVAPTVAVDKTVVTMTTAEAEQAAEAATPAILDPPGPEAPLDPIREDRMEMDSNSPAPSPRPENEGVPDSSSSNSRSTRVRPDPPIPTRSTLAQSSFSWMLEPDVSPSTTPASRKFSSSPSAAGSGGRAGHRKRPSGNNINRERNAFLFGEVTTSDSDGPERALTSDEIFGLEPLKKALPSPSSPGNKNGTGST